MRQKCAVFMRFISRASRWFATVILLLGVALDSSAGAATNALPAAPLFAPAPFPSATPTDRSRWSAALTKPSVGSVADLKGIERQVKTLAARTAGAVVAVEIVGGTGSGVIISADGLVLTAGHVAGRAGRDVRFRFPNGRSARGVTLGANADNDTGFARITDRGTWPFLPVGELDSAVIGDWVLALGHPGGFDPERPRVVRLGRIIRLAQGTLQTDCTISPGDSGGPLLDMQGRVIGIHSFISTAMVENYHVPITKFRDDWGSLSQPQSKPTTPPAGPVHFGANATDDPAGCRLDSVERRSPAARAGLQRGDVVVTVEGRRVLSAATFLRWLNDAQPGDVLALEIRRDAESLNISVELPALKSAR